MLTVGNNFVNKTLGHFGRQIIEDECRKDEDPNISQGLDMKP